MRSAFDRSMTNSIPCSGSSPRSTRSDSSAVATVAPAFPQPERDLHALGGDPQRDDHHPPLQLGPVEHRQGQITRLARHELAERLADALHERSGHRALRRRPRCGLDLLADRFLRAAVPKTARRLGGGECWFSRRCTYAALSCALPRIAATDSLVGPNHARVESREDLDSPVERYLEAILGCRPAGSARPAIQPAYRYG